ncbi:hypothetical protein L3Q82_008881 [Scortum barcoo]|uniref:Uncharacterized protein n=1 Tax=Scortum barcoo TaxID=214431 RepID=A0ACB8XDC2_9TELE|nr:hypothetical protein L3Q82_008881 [Scortum barcoo]
MDSARKKSPTFELAGATQLPESTNCLACSDDGRYLSLGHSQGLSVWCASSLTCVAERLQDRLEVTSIQMTRMAEAAYLLGTIDDMGVARVFAYHCEDIHLLSVMNIMENINKRSICWMFELSEGGHYGVASISCNGALWLEVYHFPSEVWLKELETAHSQKQFDIEYKKRRATESAKYVHNYRHCTHHFLLPYGQFPGDTKAKSQPAGLPVALCVWWSGSRNLLQYLLQKAPKNKPADVEPMLDVLWPNAKEILCSAVSRCTRYIALGLDDALVCVWDRQSGSPLSVVLVSATDSVFVRMQFVDCWPGSADEPQTFTAAKVHLLAVCKSGAIHTITTGRGMQPCTTLLTERPQDSRALPTVTVSLPFLQSLSLVVQRNGNMFLQDVINKTTVCSLIPPTTHLIATPCKPVYALNTRQQTLFIQGEAKAKYLSYMSYINMDMKSKKLQKQRQMKLKAFMLYAGDQDTSCSVSSEGRSQLFIFRFGECEIVKPYIVSPPDSPQQQKTLSCVTLEESCNLYLQERLHSLCLYKAWQRVGSTNERSGHYRGIILVGCRGGFAVIPLEPLPEVNGEQAVDDRVQAGVDEPKDEQDVSQ